MSAMTGKLNVEVEIKSPADKFWNAIRDCNSLFPKALPDLYKSIQVIEGDGKSVGSVRLVNFSQGETEITSSKEKIESVDEGKKTLSHSVIDGDLLKHYKNYKATFVVSGKGNGSVVKWSCDFDKLNDDVPNPEFMKEFAVRKFQELDAYLLKASS